MDLYQEKAHGKIHESRFSRDGNLDEMRAGKINSPSLLVCPNQFIIQLLKIGCHVIHRRHGERSPLKLLNSITCELS